MRIESPLANFTELLAEVSASAKIYSSTLRSNEAATRAVLVDPVIRALGWNTGNPAMVEVEKTFFQARVDYALYDSNSDVKVIVEAKKLGENLNNQSILLALVNYAFTSEVRDIFLTDGILWHHFSGFEPGKLAPSKILDLHNDELVEIAAYLVQRLDAARYWPEENGVDELSLKVNQIQNSVANLEKELNQLKNSFPVKTEDFFPKKHQTTEIEDFVSLSKIGDAKNTKPSKLLLPDKTIISVGSWSEVLRECVKFTLDKNPNIPIPLPDKAGRKVNLLSDFPPQKDVSYVELEYQGKPTYLYENYDSNNCIANAIYALKMAPDNYQEIPTEVTYK